MSSNILLDSSMSFYLVGGVSVDLIKLSRKRTNKDVFITIGESSIYWVDMNLWACLQSSSRMPVRLLLLYLNPLALQTMNSTFLL